MSIFKTGGLIRKNIQRLVPLVGSLILGANVHAVPASKVNWGWDKGGEPTFANEAYGPHSDVDTGRNSKGKPNIGDNQLMDVWVPDGAGPFPVYVYAHGGGFKGGSKKRMVLAGPLLQKDNVVYVNINYRLQGQTPAAVTTSINDTVLCLEFLKANKEKYKINPEQLFLGGGSAGGLMMNDIVYKQTVSGIKGLWQWNLYGRQSVKLEDKQLLAKIDIPVVNVHPDLYPSDKSHSALDAFNHSESNWKAGNRGTFFNAIKEHPSAIGYGRYRYSEQIWKDGKWIKDSRNGTDTGEKIPNLAEWIYEIVGGSSPTP